MPNLFKCPNGHIGRVDDDQAEGEVSIICTECDFHGYVEDGEMMRYQDTGSSQSASNDEPSEKEDNRE